MFHKGGEGSKENSAKSSQKKKNRTKEPKFFIIMTAGMHVRQLASSVPSLQSRSPSHLHFLCIHSPLRHCISLDEHLAGGVGWRPQRDGDSSDWSCREDVEQHHPQSLASLHFIPLGQRWEVIFPERPHWVLDLDEWAGWCGKLTPPMRIGG